MADMTMALAASAAFLAIAVMAVLKGRRGGSEPVAWRMALFCVDLFAYDVLQALSDLNPDAIWRWLRDGFASLAPALFYHLVIAFVGRRKAFTVTLVLAYAYCTLLALACVAPVTIGWWPEFAGGSRWALALLAAMIPMLLHMTWLLTRHIANSSAPERARTRMMLAAGLIAGIGTATDLIDIAGVASTVRLSQYSLVASAILLAVAALRLLEGLSLLVWFNAAAIALSVVLAELALFRWAGQNLAIASVGSVVVLMIALVVARLVVTDYAQHRERLMAHASLGRLAAQMAHDIRNPLASIRGTVQFLAGERAAGRSIDGQTDFLALMVDQCDRLNRLVDHYQRIGRAEPQFAPADLNEAVKESVRFLGGAPELSVKLAEALPKFEADKDLFVIALENVLRNAHEAAPGKPIAVETGAAGDPFDGASIYVSVRDQGPGMDPRTRERALEGFFTTKTQGSGLGLAFVRRVVEAHRGRLLIDSREGQGTTVRIELKA